MEHKYSEYYAEHEGKVSDKWSLYLSIYENLFAPRRQVPLSLLEIGIQNGGSLEIYSKYFPNAKLFLGCDINPDCANLRYEDERIRVIVGDANSAEIYEQIVEHCDAYDIIIDDGSHKSSDIILSFAKYFRLLKDGGIFIVEDLSCSYWQEYEGGLFDPLSSMAFLKFLVDVINHEHWGNGYSRSDCLRHFVKRYGCEFIEEDLAAIHSVEFFNSFCVIRKEESGRNILGKRFVAGRDAIVVADIQQAHDSQMPSLPQFDNLFAQEAVELHGEICRLRALVTLQQQTLTSQHEDLAAMQGSKSWRYTAPLRKLIALSRRMRGLPV